MNFWPKNMSSWKNILWTIVYPLFKCHHQGWNEDVIVKTFLISNALLLNVESQCTSYWCHAKYILFVLWQFLMLFIATKYMYVLIDPCIIQNLVKLWSSQTSVTKSHKYESPKIVNIYNFELTYEFKTDFYKTLPDFVIQ